MVRILSTILILLVVFTTVIVGCSNSPTGKGDLELIVGEEEMGENVEEEEKEIKTDSGRFVGQVDSNFIEVRISGVPDQISPRVFRLGEEVKEKFEQYGLDKDDEMIFNYILDENGQSVIIELNKFK